MPVRDIGRHGYKSDIKALCERGRVAAVLERRQAMCTHKTCCNLLFV